MQDLIHNYPLNTWRNNNVVITSKRRHFDVITSKWRRCDVITTSLSRDVFAGYFYMYPHSSETYLWSFQWRHNDRDGVSNHQPHDCILNRLFRRRSKKTSKLRVTGLCAGNSPVPGEFPAQMASNAENVSIWRRYHVHTALSIFRCYVSSNSNQYLFLSSSCFIMYIGARFIRILNLYRYWLSYFLTLSFGLKISTSPWRHEPA